MRTTEGVGLVAPKPVRVPIYLGDREEAVRVADERATYRGYAARTDQWGAGLFDDDSRKSIRIGHIGEIAYSRWNYLNTGILLPIDTSRLPVGDGGFDFFVCGYRIQVKCAATDYSELLVRTDHFEKATWNIIVRVQYPVRTLITIAGLFGAERVRDQSVAELCGWSHRANFNRLSHVEDARRGSHKNRVLPAHFFQPMSELRELLLAKQIRKGT